MNSNSDSNSEATQTTVRQLSGFERWLMSKRWRLWMFMSVGGALFMWGWGYASTAFQGIYSERFWTPGPWVTAGGFIVSQGINLFSGKIPDLTWEVVHTSCLISLIVLFLIGPTLLLTNWRKFQLADDSLKESIAMRKIFIGLIIGGMLSVPIFAMSPYRAFITVQIYQSLKETNTREAKKDAIVSDLSELAFKAKAFYFIPTSLGGGGGRWKDIPTPEGTTRDLSLADLPIASPVTGKIYGDLFPQSPNTFILEPIEKDTVLTIVGVGNETGKDTEFKNRDGRIGKVQCMITVTPHTIYVTRDIN